MYRVDCLLCVVSEEFYEGESYRPCHDRFSEHVRAAKNPSKYQDNAIGKHYATYHLNCTPKLKFTILDRQSNSVRRKISDQALRINKDKPSINEKEKLVDTLKFIVK